MNEESTIKWPLALLAGPLSQIPPARLVPGNRKLGKTVFHWSILAGVTCPGLTETCQSLCYATEGAFRFTSTLEVHFYNWLFSKTEHFVPWMLETIQKQRVRVLRIHTAGDYYSARYLRDWSTILAACPETVFYSYTRSWRLPELRPLLEEQARRFSNYHLWYSLDQDCIPPQDVPASIRLAYLLTQEEEPPPLLVDLFFRDEQHQPGQVHKYLAGTLVCPVEQGVVRQQPLTCEKCRVCFSLGRKKPSRFN